MARQSAMPSTSAASSSSMSSSSKRRQPDRSFCTPTRCAIIVTFWLMIGLVVVMVAWILMQQETDTTTNVPATDEPTGGQSQGNETTSAAEPPTTKIATTTSTSEPACATDDCKKVVSLYKESLSNINLPCDNFYDYVCKGFSESHADTTVQGWASQQVMQSVVEALLLTDMDEPAYKTANSFFTGCTQSRRHADENKAALADFFVESKLNDASFEPVDKWVELMFVYSIPVAIGLKLGDDGYMEKDKAKYMFEMVEGGEFELWQTQLASVSGRGEYIEEVLRAAGANLTHFPVANITTAEDTVVAKWKQRTSGEQHYGKRKMSQLLTDQNNDTLETTWINALQKHSNNILPGEFYVRAGGQHYDFFKDFMRTPPDELRLYVAWEVTRLLFVVAGVNTTVNDSDILLRCYDLSMQRLQYAFVSPYLFPAVSDGAIQAVKNMTEIIRAKALDVIHGASLTGPVLTEAVGKISSMQFMYGYPEGLRTVGDLNKHYSSFGAEENGVFLRTFLNVSREYMASLLRTVRTDPLILNTTSIEPHRPITFYVYGTNMVKIPSASMLHPWYFQGAPAAINYGSLGRVLVNEMMRTFDLFGRNYDASGSTDPATETEWRKNTDDHYNKTLDCIFRISESGKRPDSVIQESEGLLFTLGLDVLYEAYKAVAKNAPSVKLQGLDNVTDDQLFYIGYCYSTCAGKNVQGSSLLLRPQAICNLPLENSVHFAATFGCPTKSGMNSGRKCNFWSNIGRGK